MALSSFLAAGGQRMQVVVWAGSPGQAIAAAQAYRAWLLAHDLWGSAAAPLQVLDAGAMASG